MPELSSVSFLRAHSGSGTFSGISTSLPLPLAFQPEGVNPATSQAFRPSPPVSAFSRHFSQPSRTSSSQSHQRENTETHQQPLSNPRPRNSIGSPVCPSKTNHYLILKWLIKPAAGLTPLPKAYPFHSQFTPLILSS